MAAITSRLERHRDGLTLAALLVVALAVRLFRLGTIPANVMLDEADNAQNAFFVLAGRGSGIFGLDWSQAPQFSIYLLAGWVGLCGDSIAAIRSWAAVLSTASLVPFFLLARRRVDLLAAAAATFLLATSLWYLHFSRTAWINMTAPLFALSAAYYLTRALEDGRRRDYLLCGLLVAFGAYGYPAGRSIAFAVAAALPVALLLAREGRKRTLVGFVAALALAAALFAPHLWVLWTSPVPLTRMSAVSIFARQEYLGDTDHAAMILHQIGRNVAGFFLLDSSQMGRGLWAHYLPPGRTVLDRATGAVFWLGLAVGLLRWRATFVWWLFLLVPVLTVQVLSVQTPDAGRGLIVAPFMYLFVALGIASLLQLGTGPWRWPVAGLGVFAVLGLGTSNIREYFDWIQSRQALEERHPAVELVEFGEWSRLQREDAATGGLGFVVSDWRQRIDGDGCKNGTLSGAVCRPIDPAIEAVAEVPKRAGDGPVAVTAPALPASRPPVRASGGTTAAERDQARRHDLLAIARALGQLRDTGRPYPSTGGHLQTLCAYADDAGCALHGVLDPIPADPRDGGANTGYWYRSDGAAYTLYAVLEGAAAEGEQEACPARPPHIGLPGELLCRHGG